MPSPVGHALVGLTIAWTTETLNGGGESAPAAATLKLVLRRSGSGLAVACAILAFAPDLDILIGGHRGPSHSLGGAVIVGALAAGIAKALRLQAWTVGAACAAAVASHVGLDWLGRDTSIPLGIEALWPFSTRYYSSGLDLFWDISRRYWLPREFILGNLVALARELLIFSPFVGAALYFRFFRNAARRS